MVKFWDSGVKQFTKNVRFDDPVTINDSVSIYSNVALAGKLTVSGIVNGIANAVKSKNTSTHRAKSLDPSNEVWVESNCVVNPSNSFFVDDVQKSDPDKDELFLNANVRIVGEIRQGASAIAPTVQSALAFKAEKEGVKSVMSVTPDPVWFP